MRSTSVRSVGAALLKRGRARAGRSIPPKECGTRSGVTQLVSAVPGEGSSVLSRSVIRTNARCATSQVRVFASGDRAHRGQAGLVPQRRCHRTRRGSCPSSSRRIAHARPGVRSRRAIGRRRSPQEHCHRPR